MIELPRLVNHDERKTLIGEATFKVLLKHGLQRLTVRKIAEEAGLTIGGVQYYFSNQQELYVHAMELILKRSEERIHRSVQKGGDVFNGVIQMLKQLIPLEEPEQRMEIESWFNFAIMALKDEELNEYNERIRQSTKTFMKYIIEILSKNKLLKSHMNIDEETDGLYLFIDGLTLQAILYPSHFDDRKVEIYIGNYLSKLCKE